MTDYEKLKGIIDEINTLIADKVNSDTPSFKKWKNKAECFIVSVYDRGSYQFQQFEKISFHEVDIFEMYGKGPSVNQVEKCKKGLIEAQGQLENMLEGLKEKETLGVSISPYSHIKQIGNCTKVFIVHGHNGEFKEAVARIIEKQGINAIILSEQANKGRTIIEKFEDYSDVSGAICLFTADDYGRAKTDETDNTRARQNVVLETGYFMGKLGRDHVVLLADRGIEIPSDLSGVVYTDTAKWEIDLLKELKEMGYTVDFNKLFYGDVEAK